MEKQFEKWCLLKKEINTYNNRTYRPRDIWWCTAGENIGSEESGKGDRFARSVLIVTSFGREVCLIVPLTSSENIHKYRIPIGQIDGVEAKVIISQMRVVDSRRLEDKICYIDKDTLKTVKKAIKDNL